MILSRPLTLGAFGALAAASSAQAVFSGSGAAGTLTALNDFRAAIGGANNGAGGGPQAAGRREINWDAVKLDGTDANAATEVLIQDHLVNIPTNRFAARGMTTATPYTVSNDGFASANPSLAGQINAFSPLNTFGMANGNALQMSFNLAGTASKAGTRGFGAIFNDVDLAGFTTMEMFSGATSLGVFDVATSASGGTSFLGVLFNDARVTDVTLKLGNSRLFNLSGGVVTAGGSEDIENVDLVATDDFVFAEPTAVAPVPEPATMVALGLGAAGVLRRRRKG